MRIRPNVEAPPPTGEEVFPKTLHVEQDVFAATNVYKDPDGDFWVWDYVYAGFGAKSFAFRTDGAAGFGGGQLTVRLKGGTGHGDEPGPPRQLQPERQPDRRGVLGRHSGSGDDAQFDGSLLVDGENTLTIDGLTDTGAPYSLFYVDSFDVRYTSRYRAHGNKVEAQAAGNASVLISGFTRPDIAVFNITVPTTPVILQGPVSRRATGRYGVVVARGTRGRSTTRSPRMPSRAPRASCPTPLRAPRGAKHDAEYLVITTQALKQTAQTLADYRHDLQIAGGGHRGHLRRVQLRQPRARTRSRPS